MWPIHFPASRLMAVILLPIVLCPALLSQKANAQTTVAQEVAFDHLLEGYALIATRATQIVKCGGRSQQWANDIYKRLTGEAMLQAIEKLHATMNDQPRIDRIKGVIQDAINAGQTPLRNQCTMLLKTHGTEIDTVMDRLGQ